MAEAIAASHFDRKRRQLEIGGGIFIINEMLVPMAIHFYFYCKIENSRLEATSKLSYKA